MIEVINIMTNKLAKQAEMLSVRWSAEMLSVRWLAEILSEGDKQKC